MQIHEIIRAINLFLLYLPQCFVFIRVKIYMSLEMEYIIPSNLLYGRNLVRYKFVDHADVGASPVSAAPTTSFSTLNNASMDWATATARRDEKHWRCGIYV